MHQMSILRVPTLTPPWRQFFKIQNKARIPCYSCMPETAMYILIKDVQIHTLSLYLLPLKPREANASESDFSDIAKPAWVNRQKCPFTLLTPKPKQNLSSQQGVQVQTWEHHLWRTSSTQGLWILPLTGFQTLSPSPSPTTVPACLSVPFHSILSTPLCDPITTTFLCPLTKQEASPRHSVAATAAPAGLSVSQMSPWSFRALNSGLKLTQFNYFIYCSYFTHVHY